MADAKKCDVCGKLYEAPICNDVIKIDMDYGYRRNRYIDLCEDCYNKICNFVKPALPKDVSVERKKK